LAFSRLCLGARQKEGVMAVYLFGVVMGFLVIDAYYGSVTGHWDILLLHGGTAIVSGAVFGLIYVFGIGRRDDF